jgi:YHS domain-containing protein
MSPRIGLLTVALVVSACHPASEPAAQTGPLEAWDPVSEGFAGCQESCGAHVEGASADIVSQPGASIGQRTYCPVSGAVFEVTASHPHVEVDGQTLWFCCDGCAAYFEAHREEVLSARGANRADVIGE